MSFFGLFPPNVRQLEARRDVRGLIDALRKKDLYTQHEAARALAKVADGRSVPLLIEALHDKYKAVRTAATTTLGRLRDPRAVDPLIASLSADDGEVTIAAIQALGLIRDRRAVEPLIATLQTRYRPATAIEALGQIGDPRAIEPIIALLKHAEPDVRQEVERAFRHFQDVRLAIALRDWPKVATFGPAAVEPLIVALRDDNKDVRTAARKVLGQLGDSRAIEPLLSGLLDGNWNVENQQAIGRALTQIDPNWLTSELALRALSQLITRLKNSRRPVNLIPPLRVLNWPPLINMIRLLNETTIQLAVDFALNEIDSVPTIEILWAILEDETLGLGHQERFFDYHKGPPTSLGENALKTLERVLEQAGSRVDSQVLRGLTYSASTKIIKYSVDYGCDASSNTLYRADGYTTLDCSRLCQLARQELIRRGEQAS